MVKKIHRRGMIGNLERILNEAKGDWTPKTYLFYKTGTSYSDFNRQLNALVKAGYLEFKENPNYKKHPEKSQTCQLQFGKKTGDKEEFPKNIKSVYKINEEGLEFLKILKEASLKLDKVKRFL